MHDGEGDVIVVGGGISGLTVAWRLHQADFDVCLIEADLGVGGCVRTEKRNGFLLEKGPFNIIVRHPAFQSLLEEMSDDIKVIAADPAARKRFIYHKGRLHLVPTNPIALMTTGLLRMRDRIRLLRGLIYSPCAGQQEETIEQAATRRFGRAVSDTMVSAAISGIIAGDIRRLSLKACFPGVWRIDYNAKSLLGHGLASMFQSRIKKRARQKRRWRGLVSIDGGLGALTAAIGQRLGSHLLTDARVESVQQLEYGFELHVRCANEHEQKMKCRRLILASPLQEASRLLKPICPDASDILDSMESASLVVLSLGFRRADIGHDLRGFGFLVPHNEKEFPLMGVLWADSIFPHHAPPDHRLIRVFIGGTRDLQAIHRSDDELVSMTTSALRPLLQLKGDPVMVDVCRYPAAIPQYHLGHGEKVAQLLTLIRVVPGLYLIGNYLNGISINDCVRLATETARDIIQTITMKLGETPRPVGESMDT